MTTTNASCLNKQLTEKRLLIAIQRWFLAFQCFGVHCFVLFFSCIFRRCAEIIGDSSTDSMTCGNINDHSWSGVIMKSTCELNNEYTSDCKNFENLSLSMQRELPMFDAQNNVTYRSIACARCNNADPEKLIPSGLRVTCPDRRTKLPEDKNINTIKTFLKDKCYLSKMS